MTALNSLEQFLLRIHEAGVPPRGQSPPASQPQVRRRMRPASLSSAAWGRRTPPTKPRTHSSHSFTGPFLLSAPVSLQGFLPFLLVILLLLDHFFFVALINPVKVIILKPLRHNSLKIGGEHMAESLIHE